MVIYSKLVKSPSRQNAVASATGRLSANASGKSSGLQTEDPFVAQNTLFYDHRGHPILDLVYYDTNTHKGKKRLPNGELKDCFIKKVRVTIGQFGINPRLKDDEVHIESIKEVVKSGIPGKAQSAMMNAIEERIREKRRQEGRPI